MGRVRRNEKQFKHQGISWIQTELKSANERSTGDSFYHHYVDGIFGSWLLLAYSVILLSGFISGKKYN